VLTHSTPHRAQTVETPPPEVQFDFNEPVEVSFGAVRVYDEGGDRVDDGEIVRPDGESNKVAVGLRDGLGDGVYTGTYRVVSADGHPVSGGFSFGVGEALPTGGSAPSVADLLEESDAGAEVEVSYGVVRGLHYAALLFLIGAFAFATIVWPRAGLAIAWPRGWVIAAATLGLVTSVLAIGLQGVLGAGVSLGHVLDRTILDGSLDTRSGEAWAIRAGAWLVVLILVATAPRPPQRWLIALAAAALAVVVVSLPLAGHADTHSPEGLLVSTDLVHVLAAGVWLGGLLTLLAVYWPRRGVDATPDGRKATASFSRIALPAMALLIAVGILQGWIYLGSLTEIVSGTYGIALLSKIALVAVIVALATRSRRAVARFASGGATQLRRLMSVEVALAVLVIAATAVLVRAAPPATVASGPAQEELDLGPMRLEMVIEPAKVGPNDFHLYLFNRKTGAQVGRVKQMTVRLTQPEKDIGPITLDIPRKGPAHYELLDQALGVPGEWEVEVDARVSAFDAYTATADIDVRGD
jgi:copper transport protein